MQAVLFDVDGTLIDSVDIHARAWQEAFAHFGHDFLFDKIRAQIGKGGDQLLPVFLPPDELRRIGHRLEEWRTAHYKANYMMQVRPFPKVRELFGRILDDGWKIGLASSAKTDELEYYKNLCGVSDLLDAETSADDAKKSKPYPDIFQAAAARLGIAARECWVVGDTPYDAEAAARAEMRSVGFLSGGFAAEDLRRAGAVALYRDAADLLAHYGESVFALGAPGRIATSRQN